MIWHSLVIIFGLVLFEVVSSIDNAIINAHVLKTLPEKYKKFFLTWGLFLAVFVIRGVLPFVIVWSVSDSKPILLLGGGVYLFMVFLGWLFMEEKKYEKCCISRKKILIRLSSRLHRLKEAIKSYI